MGLAAVTGASGFVGSHLVRHLLDEGFSVRCLLREKSSTRWLPEDRIEINRGSLTDTGFLAESLEGADYVFHVAGAVWAPSEEEYIRSNVDATALLAETVRTSVPRIKRVVLVSSLAAAGPSQPGSPKKESDSPAPTSPYGRSKLEGERALLKVLENRATVLRPPAVLGPRDVAFLKLYRLVKWGVVPQVGRRGQEVNLIHVEDLVRGIVSAAQAEATKGQTYFLCDPRPTNFQQVSKIAASALGRSYRSLPIPNSILVPFSQVLQFVLPALGLRNPYPPDRVRDLLQPAWICSPEKAKVDFSFETQISHEDGITDAVRWCVEAGWL